MLMALKRARARVGRLVRVGEGEKGQAYIEMLVLLPLFVVIIVGVIYFGRAYYANIAAEEAAYDCARAAIEAMHESQHGDSPGGRMQGVIAARQALAGFYLDASNADVRVAPIEVWGRGQAVRCDVRYRVDMSGVPWLHWIQAEPALPVWGSAVGQVEAYKSKWP
jgi:hypothetical protein